MSVTGLMYSQKVMVVYKQESRLILWKIHMSSQLQEPKFREFYLSYSGYAQCGPLHCYGPASRPHYLIHFVVKGKGMYQASGQKHYLTAGQGFLIEPGTQTFYQADKDDPWSYLWIGVGGTNAGKYIRDIGLNQRAVDLPFRKWRRVKENCAWIF